mmetsp:Transcript_39402/g.81823  ORF Transcript_39402/g.81823 Transcript_39402/m.81823 type:complete len:208 (+) Transcript_39402:1100-1723(+)
MIESSKRFSISYCCFWDCGCDWVSRPPQSFRTIVVHTKDIVLAPSVLPPLGRLPNLLPFPWWWRYWYFLHSPAPDSVWDRHPADPPTPAVSGFPRTTEEKRERPRVANGILEKRAHPNRWLAHRFLPGMIMMAVVAFSIAAVVVVVEFDARQFLVQSSVVAKWNLLLLGWKSWQLRWCQHDPRRNTNPKVSCPRRGEDSPNHPPGSH